MQCRQCIDQTYKSRGIMNKQAHTILKERSANEWRIFKGVTDRIPSKPPYNHHTTEHVLAMYCDIRVVQDEMKQ